LFLRIVLHFFLFLSTNPRLAIIVEQGKEEERKEKGKNPLLGAEFFVYSIDTNLSSNTIAFRSRFSSFHIATEEKECFVSFLVLSTKNGFLTS
jgi:hypothetical protein